MADPTDKTVIPQSRPANDEALDSSGGSLVRQTTQISYEGPLPPPGVLAEFERVLPGSADRIITMAEKQLEHRMHLEKVVVEGGAKRADKGIYAAVLVEAMFLATSAYLAHLGQTAQALEVMGTSAVALLGAFGYGTYSRRQEREKKQMRLDSPETDAPK